MTNYIELVKAVVPLVVAHLCPKEFFDAQASDSAIRRLARRIEQIDRLVRVARADQIGRPPMAFDGFPAGDWLLNRARVLEVEEAAPKPIMMGRHLIKLGLVPGPHFGTILEACYEAQIEGKFSTLEEGIAYAKLVLEQETQDGII